MGLSNVPSAGELFEIRPDLDDARTKAEERGISQRTQRLANMAGEGKITLQSLAAAAAVKEEGLEFGRLNIILKVDVAGSAEAIRSALEVKDLFWGFRFSWELAFSGASSVTWQCSVCDLFLGRMVEHGSEGGSGGIWGRYQERSGGERVFWENPVCVELNFSEAPPVTWL